MSERTNVVPIKRPFLDIAPMTPEEQRRADAFEAAERERAARVVVPIRRVK